MLTSLEPRIALPADLSPALFQGWVQGRPVRRYAGETMGTDWSLAIAADVADPRAILQAVCAEVIAESSLWDPTSVISRYNAAAAGETVDLPPGFAAVLQCALSVAADSDGAFDPTVGALSHLWGFGPQGHQPAPAAHQIRNAAAGRWRELEPEHTPAGIRLRQPGSLHLDFNAIAKGQAVDRVAEALLAAGARHFLVGIGGEYRGEGVCPDGQPWWVDIEQPPGARLAPLRLALSGWSVATSGDYRRYHMAGSKRRSHSLDPVTGHSIADEVCSVAVMGKSCMLADAQATAITVLGPEKGLAWARARQIPMQMLLRDGRDFHEIISPALEALLS